MIPTKITSFSTSEIFRRLLNNKSKTNYWRYIMELRKRKSSEIYNRAIELTKSSDKKEKIIGINILAQFGNPRIGVANLVGSVSLTTINILIIN